MDFQLQQEKAERCVLITSYLHIGEGGSPDPGLWGWPIQVYGDGPINTTHSKGELKPQRLLLIYAHSPWRRREHASHAQSHECCTWEQTEESRAMEGRLCCIKRMGCPW